MRLIRFTAFSTFSSRRRLLPSILLNTMCGHKRTDEGERAYIAACFSSTAILNKYAKIDKLHIGV